MTKKQKLKNKSLKVEQVYDFLCDFAPLQLAEDWDNVGLQVGNLSNSVKKVLISLDITEEVIAEAVNHGAELIVSHHPLFFKPVQCFSDSEVTTRLARLATRSELSILAFHTNLDATQKGLNDVLASTLQLKKTRPLVASRDPKRTQAGLGRVGQLSKKVSLQTFMEAIHSQLALQDMRFVGSVSHEIKKVAVMTGSGAGFIQEALAAGADVLVTGDLKYHQALEALAQGLAIVDIGHFSGEIAMVELVSKKIKTWLKKNNYALEVFETRVQSDPIQYWNSENKKTKSFLENFKIA